MGIVDDYLSYTKKYKLEYGENTLVLMQVGSFFEVYGLKCKDNNITGSNIEDFSRICDMVISGKNQKIKGNKVMMAGFGLAQIEKYIKKLQNTGYTIVIYTQDTKAKNTTRSLSEIISPGTYFASESDKLTNNIMCIWLHYTKKTRYSPEKLWTGIACLDNFTGKSRICQFEREYYKDSSIYDDLERQISIDNPQECIVISNLENDYVEQIVQYVGLSNVKTHLIDQTKEGDMVKFSKNAEKQVYQNEVMTRFFPNISPELIINTFKTHCIAMQAFTFLVDFIFQHSPVLVNKMAFPIFESNAERLLLANHSLRQLNIIDDSRHKGKLRSVAALLNNCMTAMGKRGFNYQITSPHTNIEKLECIYNLTEHALNIDMWENIRNGLRNVRDLDNISRRMVFNKISPRQLCDFMKTIKKIMEVGNMVNTDDTFSDYVKINDMLCIKECEKLSNIIEKTFDCEKAQYINDISPERLGTLMPEDACFVKKGINIEIDDLLEKSIYSSEKLEAIQSYLCSLIETIEKKKKNPFVKIHETPKSDPFLIATKRRTTLLKSAIEKAKLDSVSLTTKSGAKFDLKLSEIRYITMGSNKKDLCITNGAITKIANNIQKSRDKLIHRIGAFFYNFINDIVSMQESINKISRFASWADNLQNRCYIAKKYNYCKPKIVIKNKSYFDIEGLRHPLIEQLQINELYVTNDICMGDVKDGLLLYGTNAVGKTSFIRAVGISIVMAQAGLYVPCKSMTFNPYNKLFTRILGNDNLFKGLSTFAVEMSELRTILTMSDENSLVIGDELCSGTESDSAKSIFTTGVEWLHEKKATFLFATHFHEVNEYSEIEDMDRLMMKHMSVIYDSKNDKLVYNRKLQDGPGENMYGLEVCKSLNLPAAFLKRAHGLRMKYDPKKSNILAQKTSRYNSKKLRGNCKLCGKKGDEIHHLKHQINADVNGFFKSHHKNHPANLINLCESCHDKIHEDGKQHKIVKTSNGYEIEPI